MSDSRKCRFIGILILAVSCVLAGAAGSEGPVAGLKFEYAGESVVDWRSGESYGRTSRVAIKKGLIEPSHRGELFVGNIPFSGSPQRRGSQRLTVDFQTRDGIEKILGTATGRKISGAQRKFIEGGKAICRDGSLGDEVSEHFRFWIYGVSREAVEKTTEAFIEFLTAEAEANMQYWLSEIENIGEEQIPDANRQISETLGEFNAAEAKLASLKKTVKYISVEEAMQTVVEFNSRLNLLELEVVGLQAKVAANQEYVRQEHGEKGNLTDETYVMVQQILADDVIELAGALAKKQAATKIRDQAKSFYDLHIQLDDLPKKLKNLENSLRSLEEGLAGARSKRTDPHGGAVGPTVFENKVVINAVHTD